MWHLFVVRLWFPDSRRKWWDIRVGKEGEDTSVDLATVPKSHSQQWKYYGVSGIFV